MSICVAFHFSGKKTTWDKWTNVQSITCRLSPIQLCSSPAERASKLIKSAKGLDLRGATCESRGKSLSFAAHEVNLTELRKTFWIITDIGINHDRDSLDILKFGCFKLQLCTTIRVIVRE